MFRSTTITTTKPLFAEQANYSDSLARRIKNKKSQKIGLTLELMCKEYSLFIYGSETVSCSVMSHSLQPHGTVPCQAPLSMGFPRQEYWSGLLFPSPGDLPHPGIEPESPTLQADSFPSEPPGKPLIYGKLK